MITINTLNRHQSSSAKIYGNLVELAKRKDLFTGEDFYFGFDSSNHSFLDILSHQEPLAIKYGPIFSIYCRNAENSICDFYYINDQTEQLIPLMKFQADATAALVFNTLLPWNFTDLYLERFNPSVKQSRIADAMKTPILENTISAIIEKFANNSWLDDTSIHHFTTMVSELQAHEKAISITLSPDFPIIAQKKQSCKKEASKADFVATYNPMYDNPRFDLDFIFDNNPSHVTVREMKGKYPCIEILFPFLSDEKSYQAIYERTDSELYHRIQANLCDSLELSKIVNERYPELVSEFFLKDTSDRQTQKPKTR